MTTQTHTKTMSDDELHEAITKDTEEIKALRARINAKYSDISLDENDNFDDQMEQDQIETDLDTKLNDLILDFATTEDEV